MAVEPGRGSLAQDRTGVRPGRDRRLGATVLKATLIALCIYLAIVASEVLLTIGLAVVFAFGLDRLVTWFTRRGVGRGKASLLDFALLFLVVTVLVIWAAAPIWNEIRSWWPTCPPTSTTSRTSRCSSNSTKTEAVSKARSVARDAAKAIPQAATALLGITGALVGSVSAW